MDKDPGQWDGRVSHQDFKKPKHEDRMSWMQVCKILGKTCELVANGTVKTNHWKKWYHLCDFLETY